MSKHMKRYLKYIRGMSLIETAFASAALSVVVVTGLTVASDTIKSRAKGDARVAMLSENVASIEKARHDWYAAGDKFDAANDSVRTLDRQRLLDADKDKLTALKATYEQDGAKLYIKTSGDYAILDGANKIALKTAIAGNNEALSIFRGTPDNSIPKCTTSIFSGSGKGKSKGKGKGKSKSWTSKGKKAELKIKGTNMACPTSGAFTASVSTSFCTFGFSKSGESPNAKCKDDEIFENTTAVVTLDPTDQYCTGDGTASSGMCSVSFNLTAADYQQTFYIQLTDDASKCTFAPTWDEPSRASKMGVSSKGCE
ncbi:hypothetical protein N9X48_01725 [Luminiphilus sp.]|nr:hypothetical protein [Luminiphilus sp.]